MPVPLFTVVMGTAGLGLAWRKAHEVFGWTGIPGEAVLALSALLFVTISVLYAAKAIRHLSEVQTEFRHPVRVNFFPAISIGFLLMAAAAAPYSLRIAEILWIAGASVHLLLAIAIFNRWITRNHEIHHSSPAWFIPVVGTILVPIAGVRLGYVEVSWFFFSIGIVFWILLFAIVLNRIIFHDQLPARFLPTLFILMAPPAVGMIAHLQLNGGALDALCHILFGTGLFIAMLLTSMARLFLRVPFFVSWWAYTFPSAAMAIAGLLYHQLVPGAATSILAVGLLLIATIIVGIVAARTLAALVSGSLIVPE